ncbi:MAG: hypothetical protein P8O16_14965 [Algoriphagus sp.]|jgi:hypothetical protein|uniref:hypothetical protein n=1 Tax=Algoriphagus sp. TaxID=1872435 RepID=UPI00262EA347|nr:hypothetical protein [Algoriphagus sp.]MDG1278582.1 hypothetical protein [Algoriphagus sp.]
MKLSSDQIIQIQNTISKGSIYYEDIRFELLDHRASAIEGDMKEGVTFEQAMKNQLKDFNEAKFQREILLHTHLGMLKSIFKEMLNFRILFKVLLMTVVIVGFMNLFAAQNPAYSETLLKVSMMIAITLLAILGLFSTRLLRNSQVMSAGNTLFLMGSLSQYFLRLEWLQWTGLSDQTLLYGITFWFCLLLTAGFRVLATRITKVQTT